MASIIEKETAVPEERPVVASVYYNRLGRNIALQADPSVIYAELLEGSYGGALHHADMRFQSGYNTYTHTGLPPGTDRQSRPHLPGSRHAPGARRTISILSATATATTAFPAVLRNTIRTSPSCGR